MKSTSLYTNGTIVPLMWAIFPSWGVRPQPARQTPSHSLFFLCLKPHAPTFRRAPALLLRPNDWFSLVDAAVLPLLSRVTTLCFRQVKNPAKDSPVPDDVHWTHATKVVGVDLSSGVEQQEAIAEDAGFTKKHLAHGARAPRSLCVLTGWQSCTPCACAVTKGMFRIEPRRPVAPPAGVLMGLAWGVLFPTSAMSARFLRARGGPLFFKARRVRCFACHPHVPNGDARWR